MFSRGRKQPSLNKMAPKLSKQHDELREEIVKSRELLMAEIRRLNKKFDLSHPKRKP